MLTTTLNNIRKHNPCEDGWEKLLKHLGKTKPDDEPLPYSVIVESNGLYDALWCCRAEPRYVKQWRLYAVWCARQVSHLMKDERSLRALEVAEEYAHGKATDSQLSCARIDAREVCMDYTWDVWDVSWDAWDAARAAAGATNWTAAGAAVRAVRSTEDAVKAKQKEKFLEIVNQEG